MSSSFQWQDFSPLKVLLIIHSMLVFDKLNTSFTKHQPFRSKGVTLILSQVYWCVKMLLLYQGINIKRKVQKTGFMWNPPLSKYHQTGILGMEIVIIIIETTTLFSIVTLLSWCLLLAIIYYVHESIEIYSECICLKGLNFHFFWKILSKKYWR